MSTLTSSQESLVVTVGVQCHTGKQRAENQDRVTRAATPFGELFLVADGMGGYQGGGEAAEATVDGFVNYLGQHGSMSLPEALQQAAHNVSAGLLQRGATDPALQGMGSTVVLCVVNGPQVTYAHLGDSRAYLLRDGKLQQLTRDHSVMERLITQGLLTPEQAREHPDASILTRAIGQDPDLSLDIAEITVQPNDALLLCSDGLWGYAQAPEMEAVAKSRNLSASAVAEALLNLALDGGGGDNISIQFLRFAPAAAQTSARSLLGTRRKATTAVFALAAVLAIATIGGALWIYYHGVRDKQQSRPITAPSSDKALPSAAGAPSKEKLPQRSAGTSNKSSKTPENSDGETPAQPEHKSNEKSPTTPEQPSLPERATEDLGKATDKVRTGVSGAVDSVKGTIKHHTPSQATPPQSDAPPPPATPQQGDPQGTNPR